MVKLSAAEIKTQRTGVPLWKLQSKTVTRTFECADFPAAMLFVNAVAFLAEKAQHHPDIDIRWNRVILTLSTHDADGLTDRDFALARAIDQL